LEFTRAADAPSWQALLSTRQALTLDGVELTRSSKGDKPETAHLVYCEQAPLRMVNCRLSALRGRALLVCRRSGQVEMQDCQIEAHASALCVEVDKHMGTAVRLTGSRWTVHDAQGAAVAVWSSDEEGNPTRHEMPAPVRLLLENNTVQTGQVLALARLGQQVEITARDNRFQFQDSLLSCAGCTGATGERPWIHWHGQANHYHGQGEWLSVDGVYQGVRDLAAWRAWCGDAETGSSESTGVFSARTAAREQPRPLVFSHP
jgi:hypothetical protein